MKKRILLLLIVFFGVIFLILLFLPEIVRIYAEKHSRDYIGRKVTIEKVRLNYFTTTVRVDGFKVYEPDDSTVFVSFEGLLLNLQPLNLISNELFIERLHLNGLYAKIIQEDSTFNFDDIIEFLNKPAGTANPDTTPTEPMRFRMTDFRLSHSNLIFDDRNVGKASHLRDFSLEVPSIVWNRGENTDAGINFNFGDGGYFKADLKMDPVNGTFRAQVTIDRLRLDSFQEYISYYTDIQSLTGDFHCDIKLEGNIYSAEEMIISGLLRLDSLEMKDSGGDPFLGSGKVEIGLHRADPANGRFELDSIILTGPYAHFILWDSTDNFTEAFLKDSDSLSGAEPSNSSAGATDSLTEEAIFYSVGRFVIREGTVDYTDHLTDEPFQYHLSGIRMEADSVNSRSERIRVVADMILNDRGTLKAEAVFNPFDPIHDLELNYVVSDFMLADLNIYSRFYTGIPVIFGDMFYKSETVIREGNLSSENRLVMTNVQLGRKGRGIYDLPIKLALFILKDRNGIINLDIPVRGDLNDPKIRLGKIIWNTFKNLMIKVAAAPFDALAGKLGADPKDLEEIAFDFGDSLLSPMRIRQLDLLLELERTKPGLGIELQYFNDRDLEKASLSATSGQTDPLILDSLQLAYDRSRKDILMRYIQSKRDTTHIRVSGWDPESPKNAASKPVFRAVYSLEEE